MRVDRRKEFDAVYKASELKITHSLDTILHDPRSKNRDPAILKKFSDRPLPGYLPLTDPDVHVPEFSNIWYVPSIVVAMDPLQALRTGNYEKVLTEEMHFFKKCYAEAENVASKLWFAEEAHLSCRSLLTCLNWERFDRFATTVNVVKSVCESSLDKLERLETTIETMESIATDVKKGWKRISGGIEEEIAKKYNEYSDEDSRIRKDRDEFHRSAFYAPKESEPVDFTPSFLLPFKISPTFRSTTVQDALSSREGALSAREGASSAREDAFEFDYGGSTLYQLRRFNRIVSFRLNQPFFKAWAHGDPSGEAPESSNVMLVVGSERRDSARIPPSPPLPSLDPSFVVVPLFDDARDASNDHRRYLKTQKRSSSALALKSRKNSKTEHRKDARTTQ